MFEKLLKLFRSNKTNKIITQDDINRTFQKRAARRISELNEAIVDGKVPAGHIASLILDIEMLRFRVHHELNPLDALMRQAEFVERIVQLVCNAPQTILEPAGTYDADMTYVNILGNMGDRMLALRQKADWPMVTLLEEIIYIFARPGDHLAAAILDGSYTEELWAEYADCARQSYKF